MDRKSVAKLFSDGKPFGYEKALLRVDRVRARFRFAAKMLSIPAIVSLCFEYGFVEPPAPIDLLHLIQAIAVAAYVVAIAVSVMTSSSWVQGLRRYWIESAFVAIGAVLLISVFELKDSEALALSVGYVIVVQVLLVGRIMVGAVRLNLQLSRQTLRPARLLLGTFLTVIFVGGLLLSMPRAVQPEIRVSQDPATRIINSFFTSVSATCVTGLVVYDTGNDFTHFGQLVILLLIQLGGLGIMIFSTVFSLLAGMHLSLRQSLVLQDELSHRTIGQMGELIRFILIITFGLELLGAATLYPAFAETASGVGDAIFKSIFHSVSAFCNAGFALQTDSLIPLRGGWSLYTTVMPLIVLGGLGFPVIKDITVAIHSRFAKAVDPPSALDGPLWRTRRRGRRHVLSLHSRLVLITSALLIVIPTILLAAFESYPFETPGMGAASGIDSAASDKVSMRELPMGERLDAALFLSVTARTAGFNTVSMDEQSLSPASHFLLAVLMFIGGSPGSTAGGIKTVTLAVLVLGVWRTLRGRARVEAFHRALDESTVARAAALIVVMFLLATLIVLVLSFTERTSVREALFETVSALGTVGLSTGLTERLTVAGRVIIMLAMLAGRLGPLTLLIALAGKTSDARYEYPIESVAIG